MSTDKTTPKPQMRIEDPEILGAYRRWWRGRERGPGSIPNAFVAGWRAGHLDGLQRARDLAANGLHVEPDTTLEDFLVAIDAILV